MPTPTAEPPAPAGARETKARPGAVEALRRVFSKPPAGEDTSAIIRRRRFVSASILGFLGVNFLMFLRFFFPRVLFEPKTTFRIGYPSDFGYGVDTRFQNTNRIWVVRNTEGIFVISAICTHLGCTPDWKSSENKFKCPCHGSGYDAEGVNFEGPAPRPMDRAHVELDAEGQIVVDLSRVYKWPKGEPSQFNDPGAIIRV